MDKILKIRLGRDVKDYLSITFGLMCYALGWAAFLLPYQITTGGVTGISAIIYYVTGVEIQVSYFIINALFLGFALKILGPKFSLKTVYAIFMLVKRFSRNDKSVALAKGLHELKVVFLGHIIGGWPSLWDDASISIRKADQEKFTPIKPEQLFY